MPKKKIADAFTLIHHYYISLKDMTWKLTAYINNSDPGHSSLKQQLEKNLKIIFDSPFRKSIEKQKVKKTGMTIAKVFPLYANVIIQSGFWKHKDNNILLNHLRSVSPSSKTQSEDVHWKYEFIGFYIIGTLALTPSWRRALSNRNHSIDLLFKSMDLFLYDSRPEKFTCTFVSMPVMCTRRFTTRAKSIYT